MPSPGSLLKRGLCIELEHVRLLGQGVLGVRAGGRGHDVNPVSLFQGRHPLANSLHNSGAIPAGDVGQGRKTGVFAIADVRVNGVDAGGVDADQHLVLGRGQGRDRLVDLENGRGTKVGHANATKEGHFSSELETGKEGGGGTGKEESKLNFFQPTLHSTPSFLYFLYFLPSFLLLPSPFPHLYHQILCQRLFTPCWTSSTGSLLTTSANCLALVFFLLMPPASLTSNYSLAQCESLGWLRLKQDRVPPAAGDLGESAPAIKPFRGSPARAHSPDL